MTELEGKESKATGVGRESLALVEKFVGQVSCLEPLITVVLPAFNEEMRIGDTLSSWVEFLDEYYFRNYELFVVMDGCLDQTVDIVCEFARAGKPIVPLVYAKRLGKGGALIEAYKYAHGEIIFFTDADGSLPPEEFQKFMRAIRTCDLAIGNRYFLGSDFMANLPLSRLVASRVFNVMLKVLFPEFKGMYDTQCGGKVVRRDVINAVADDLIITDFAFDVNLIYSTVCRGFSVRGVEVNYNHAENGSKVSDNILRTSFAMFTSVIRLRLYYSRFRRLLYCDSLKHIINLLLKVIL